MKRKLLCNLVCLLVAGFFLTNTAKAQSELIPPGSFIVNMGVVPQTYGNGVKPWGMVHDLIKNYRVRVKWVINPLKLKDGIDFSYNGTDFKGGTFIIPLIYRTAAVNARIAYWQTQGVVGITTTSNLTVNVSYNLKYTPRWTFDFQNGNIALGFLEEAGIPNGSFPKKYPSELNSCDDLFVMPHADPTWATHSNMLYWNLNSRGWIWGGCHAVSAIENIANPLNPSERMNFLTTNSLILWGDHSDGSPPYSYRYPADPIMQFMGIADNAMQNGSEQVFLPSLSSTWRPGTKVAAYDPTQQNVPAISPGEAAAIVYGRAFDDNNRGVVMYTGGHNINKGTADAVAAMRSFFNFSFMSVYDKAVNPIITGPNNLSALNTYTLSATLPVGNNISNYTYHWTSSCGGTFSNPFDTVTLFTAPATSNCIDCVIYFTVADGCGREYFQEHFINICPVNPPVALDRLMKVINNPDGTPAQPIGNPVPLAGTDDDGIVVSYVLKSLPTNGILYYDHDNNPATPNSAINSLPAGELILTAAQMKTLTFDPVDGFGSNTSFTYTVIDNANLRDLTPATYIIPVNPPPVTVTKICTPVGSNAGISSVCPMSATDNGAIVSYTIKSLPPVSQCKVFVDGIDAYAGQVLTPFDATLITFKPNDGKYVGYSEILYTATDNNGATDLTPATLTLQMVNQHPVTFDVTANNIASPTGTTQYNMPALSAADADGGVASFVIIATPPSNQGVLYYNNTGSYIPVVNDMSLNLTQASTLKFDPSETFTGLSFVLYTSKDSLGLMDNTPDTLSIPVKKAIPTPASQVNNNWYAGGGWMNLPDLTATNAPTAYIITYVPPLIEGKLGPDMDGDGKGDFKIGFDAGYGLPYSLTPTQATKLMFDPVKSYKGNSYFTFRAKNANGESADAAVQFINIYNTLPESNNVINSVVLAHTAGATVLANDFSGFDADWAIKPQDLNKEFIAITSLPKPTTGILYNGATPVQLWEQFTVTVANTLKFDPATGNSDTAVFTYSYVDKCLDADPTPATFKIPILGPANMNPVSTDITMAPVSIKPGIMNPVTPLNGTDADGEVVSFKIMQGLNPNEGILYLNGVAITNNQVIPADKGDELYIIPTGTWSGTADIKYKSVDDKGAFSFQTYTYIPIINAAPVAENITTADIKKAATVRIPSLLASDAEGTINYYTILSLPTLATLKCDLNGTNIYSNVTVGQMLTPAQAGRLQVVTVNTVGTTSFTYSATDNAIIASNIATYTIPVTGATLNLAPVAAKIVSTSVNMNAGLTAISPITVTDVDGTILSYTIVNIPPDFYGKLYYNNAGSYDSVLSGSLLITPAQAATLKFKPSGIYSGNITVKFTALDNMGANSNIATLVIPVLNADPLAIDISNSPIPSAGGPSFINALSATDEMEVKTFIIKELPAASSGTLVLDGSPVSINQEIPVLYANRLEFDPNPAFSGTASFKYTAMDAFGKIDWTFATVTIPVTNTLPEAIENSSQVITNKTGTGLQLLPALTGYDADGTIASYTIKTLPTGGKLYLNGAAINTLPGSGLSITPLQASQLYFDPNDNFNSTASFTFTVTDNNGNTDATPALYNMYSNVPPVTNDVNSVSMFQGQSNSPIQSLSGSDDVNLLFYSILTLPAADQGTLYLNNVALTSTSQVDTLSPAQASQLSFAPSATFKGAIFTYTATDNLEIIDVTPAVYRIPFGTIVLPVELISFTGTKSGTDNQLNWTTDQEINSDRFELERSNDGITFKKISTVNAKGNTTYKTDYAYTDKNVSGTKQYYRLKMVDIDGKSDYSRIVVIKRDKIGLDINSVTPNPFVGKLSVEITSEINGPAQLQLFDLSGKMVRSFEVKTVKGTNLYNLDKLESLNSGIYILSIRSSDGVANIKLYKGN